MDDAPGLQTEFHFGPIELVLNVSGLRARMVGSGRAAKTASPLPKTSEPPHRAESAQSVVLVERRASIRNIIRVVISKLVVFLLAIALSPALPDTGWRLVWSDEFNGPGNTPPDSTRWNYDLGGGTWGNGEQEIYTSSIANAFQDGKGHLIIRASREPGGKFTSARIRTGKTSARDTANLSWLYGRIEARIKLPFGPGVWPAFWMLGSDTTAVGWPNCGEIDILENFGANKPKEDPATIHSTVHGPNYSGGKGIGAPYHLPRPRKFTDDFHLFSVEWSENSVRFFVDGNQFKSITPAHIPEGSRWVFDHPFFIILNLAIGGPGTFVGTPARDTPFPQDMVIDYVRVYSGVVNPKPASQTRPRPSSIAPSPLPGSPAR